MKSVRRSDTRSLVDRLAEVAVEPRVVDVLASVAEIAQSLAAYETTSWTEIADCWPDVDLPGRRVARAKVAGVRRRSA
jgi:hypothetical protein